MRIFNSANRTGPVLLAGADILYTFPLSYGYLSGYLKSRGEAVEVMPRVGTPREIAARILAKKPLLAGFGNLYPELREIREVIAALDELGRDFPVVVGGQMVSPTPEFALEITGADIGIIGEGEVILHQVVTALRRGSDPREVAGLVTWNDAGATVLTGEGAIIQDLGELPPLDYECFDPAKWVPVGHWYSAFVPRSHWRAADRVIPVHGGRGCPFHCNFCYHHSPFRLRPMEAMMREAAMALERFDGNMLDFSDDLVLCSPARAAKLVEGVRGLPRPISYYLSARFDILARIGDDQLRDLAATGCRIVGPGFESGSNRILDVIGKKFHTETMLTQLERLRRYNIRSIGNFMVGQHTESRQDVELTWAFIEEALKIDPTIEFTFSIMTPFPGSPLYAQVMRDGILSGDQMFYDRYFSESKGDFDWRLICNLSAMSDEEVLDSYRWLNRRFEEEKRRIYGRSRLFPVQIRKRIGQLESRGNRYLLRHLPWTQPQRILRAGCNRAFQALERWEWRLAERHRLGGSRQ